MTIITKTFTYNLADDYLAQTGDMGKTADWTYIGPDVIYAVIDRDTNIYAGHFYLEEQDGATVPLAPNIYQELSGGTEDGKEEYTEYDRLPPFNFHLFNEVSQLIEYV